MLGALDVLFDLLVNGLEYLAGSQNDLGTGSACQGNAKELIESVGDFSVGHAGTLVEVNDGRLSVAAELASSGSGGIAGLQRMPAAQVLAAFFAMAAVDCKFTNDRLARNLSLKLLIETILDDTAAAIGTLLG
jgi:hypothetical protein